ncbi:ribonuclease E activity regulator RraA [Bacillus sp. JJ722]|uniref:ribonuclease E activity regulator RraA n=1 Tax=Bacillus sp. JJ722 TaxID=3122973 RepID=UPI002FFF41F8
MSNFKTADLCDEYSKELKICELELISYGGVRSFSGKIATVRVFEDNVLVKQALQTIEEGSVLVVDGAGSRKCALMGDMLGEIAQERKLAGVIINSCVRDSAELGKMNIGVLAIGTNPLKSVKRGQGDRDVTLSFGGIEWVPGHFVYCDEDGVIVCDRELV